jgi:hypothetical protein
MQRRLRWPFKTIVAKIKNDKFSVGQGMSVADADAILARTGYVEAEAAVAA